MKVALVRFKLMGLCLWQLYAGGDVLGEILPIPLPGRGEDCKLCRPSRYKGTLFLA